MAAYYNEFEPYAAQWLRNLVAAGHIAPGDVDDRSIKDVRADDLVGYDQCHFFAGIGGWSHALRLAGIQDSESVWTGSCPCQPFSTVGKRLGAADDRHLWPDWFDLVRSRRPRIVLGEQVATGDGLAWSDAVRSDLEGADYSVGFFDICAASVGAPHDRPRLWFAAFDVVDADQPRAGEERLQQSRELGWTRRDREAGHWSSAGWETCADGTVRLVGSGLRPMAHGVPNRLGRLRAYGNAIVPQVAAEFAAVAMACRP